MKKNSKPLVWFVSKPQTPPFSENARLEVGALLRRLQEGTKLSMPHSRPMPSIGSRVFELRIKDEKTNWRIFYRLDEDAIVIPLVFEKKTDKTPPEKILLCKKRLKEYDEV